MTEPLNRLISRRDLLKYVLIGSVAAGGTFVGTELRYYYDHKDTSGIRLEMSPEIERLLRLVQQNMVKYKDLRISIHDGLEIKDYQNNSWEFYNDGYNLILGIDENRVLTDPNLLPTKSDFSTFNLDARAAKGPQEIIVIHNLSADAVPNQRGLYPLRTYTVDFNYLNDVARFSVGVLDENNAFHDLNDAQVVDLASKLTDVFTHEIKSSRHS